MNQKKARNKSVAGENYRCILACMGKSALVGFCRCSPSDANDRDLLNIDDSPYAQMRDQ